MILAPCADQNFSLFFWCRFCAKYRPKASLLQLRERIRTSDWESIAVEHSQRGHAEQRALAQLAQLASNSEDSNDVVEV